MTQDQSRVLAQAGDHPTVIDPATRTAYALVPLDVHTAATGRLPPETNTQQEPPVEPWKHLVARSHPWRKQLYLKGRNMTVRQLLSTVTASGFTEEEAAEDLGLPVEAIREALVYAKENAALLDYETAYERLRLEQRGKRLGPQSVPG